MTSRLRLSLALAGFGIAVALLLAEGTVRAAARLSPPLGRELRGADPLAVLVEPHGDIGYRQKPGSAYTYANGAVAHANRMGFRGPEVAVPKPPGTYRVVLLGGSTSHGYGVDDTATIDAHLRRLLATVPGRVDVVNLAFDGYDSYQDFERLRSDGLALQPDLVILNSGINDVRNAHLPDLVERDERTLPWAPVLRRLRAERAQGGPSAWSRTKHHVYLARLVPVLRSRRVGTAEGNRPREVPAPSLKAAAYYERNVLRIAALTAARGTPLLVSTPPSSLRSKFAPTATSPQGYWLANAETTQRYRDTLDARLRRLADSLAREGQPVRYVEHPALPPALFLDDCHLTPAGNHAVARDFAEVVQVLRARAALPRVAAERATPAAGARGESRP